MPQSTVNKSHCGNDATTIWMALCREFNWLSFVTKCVMEIMGANGCTFVLSIYSAKCIRKIKTRLRKVFSNYCFCQDEVVK